MKKLIMATLAILVITLTFTGCREEQPQEEKISVEVISCKYLNEKSKYRVEVWSEHASYEVFRDEEYIPGDKIEVTKNEMSEIYK